MFIKDKTILLSDFDYTLYEHDDPDVFANNLEAIKDWRNHGNLFAITTGRSKESLLAIFPNYDEYVDYCVLCDGALVLDRHDKIVFSDYFGPDLANSLNATVRQLLCKGDYSFICYNGTEESQIIGSCTGKVRFWFENINDCIALEKNLEKLYGASLDFFAYHDVAFNDDTRLSWVQPNMRHLVEVNRKGIDKKAAIDKLLEATNLQKFAHVITIGDGKNDVHMLNAYRGYAVEKASPDVLAIIPHTRIVPHLHSLISAKLSLV